jgi:CrcB protein
MPVAALLFVVGAGLGAPCRYFIGASVQSRLASRPERAGTGALPLGTLTVNALGSAILGVVAALSRHEAIASTPRLAIGAAFCGSLTTFSTFAVETVRMLETGALRDAMATIALNTAVTITLAATTFAVTLALI